jgi:hypothetical protein
VGFLKGDRYYKIEDLLRSNDDYVDHKNGFLYDNSVIKEILIN